MRRVVASLTALGVAPDDIRVGWISASGDRKRWYAEQTVTVIVRDVTRVGLVLAAASSAGASSVNGPSIIAGDTDAAYDAAVSKAVDGARAIAETAASHLNLRVTGIVSVDDGSGGSSGSPYPTPAASTAASAVTDSVPIELGRHEVSATVTVAFAYAPA